jgi:hypothetical protein
LITLSEGIRQALAAILSPGEQASADAALDEGIRTFRWYRRMSGDARKRNRILEAIYRGA